MVLIKLMEFREIFFVEIKLNISKWNKIKPRKLNRDAITNVRYLYCEFYF